MGTAIDVDDPDDGFDDPNPESTPQHERLGRRRPGAAGAGVNVIGRRPVPTDAVRLALTEPHRPVTPARRRVLEHAAVLWCRELALPTIRELAGAVDRCVATTLSGFGHPIEIHAELVRIEREHLECGAALPPSNRLVWLAEHGAALGAVDRALLRLPCVVLTVVAAVSPTHVPTPMWMPSHILASMAAVGPPRTAAGELLRVLDGAASAMNLCVA